MYSFSSQMQKIVESRVIDCVVAQRCMHYALLLQAIKVQYFFCLFVVVCVCVWNFDENWISTRLFLPNNLIATIDHTEHLWNFQTRPRLLHMHHPNIGMARVRHKVNIFVPHFLIVPYIDLICDFVQNMTVECNGILSWTSSSTVFPMSSFSSVGVNYLKMNQIWLTNIFFQWLRW